MRFGTGDLRPVNALKVQAGTVLDTAYPATRCAPYKDDSRDGEYSSGDREKARPLPEPSPCKADGHHGHEVERDGAERDGGPGERIRPGEISKSGGDDAAEHGGGGARAVRDEAVLAALPSTHRLASRAGVRIGELGDESWITQQPASPCQELVQRVCSQAGFVPEVTATCGNYRSILALVGAGLGVSLIPELALAGLAPDPAVALVATLESSRSYKNVMFLPPPIVAVWYFRYRLKHFRDYRS